MSAMDFSADGQQNAFRAAMTTTTTTTASSTVDTAKSDDEKQNELETILDHNDDDDDEPPSLVVHKEEEEPASSAIDTNEDSSSIIPKRPPRLEPAPFDESKSRRQTERERILRLMNGLDALLVETPTHATAGNTLSNNNKASREETVATVGVQKAQERVKIRSLVNGLDALLVDTPPKEASDEIVHKNEQQPSCSAKKQLEDDCEHGELELKPTPTDEVPCNEKVVETTQHAPASNKWAANSSVEGKPQQKAQESTVNSVFKGTALFGATLLRKKKTEMQQSQNYKQQLQDILEKRRLKSEEIANTDLEATPTKPKREVKKPSPARSAKLEARMAIFEPQSSSSAKKTTGNAPPTLGGGSTITMASSYDDTVFTVQDRIKAFTASATPVSQPPSSWKASPATTTTTTVSDPVTDSPACLPFLPAAAMCSSIPMGAASPAVNLVIPVPEVATAGPHVPLQQPQSVASNLQVHGPEFTDPATQVASTPVPSMPVAQSLLHSSGAISATHPGQVNSEGIHAVQQQQHAKSTIGQQPAHPAHSQYLQQQRGFNPDNVQFNQLTGSPIPTPAQYAQIYGETQMAGGGVPGQMRRIESAPQIPQPQQQPTTYHDQGQQQALYHGGQGQQYNGTMRAEQNRSPYTVQAPGSASFQPMMSQPYGTVHPSGQYQMGQHVSLPPVQGPRVADVRERIMIPQLQHQPLPDTEDLAAQYPRFPMPSPMLPPPRHYRHDSYNASPVPRHSSPATVPHYDSSTRPPLNGNNHGLPLYRNAMEDNTFSNQSPYATPPMARKVLARSVESQRAQAHHGSNEIMDKSLAATPVAKTKHSRYHRGGRFLDDRVDPLEAAAAAVSLDRGDETPRRTPKTPKSSSRRSRSRTPRNKPNYRREPSDIDDENATTVTEFLNGSQTYSSSDDEDDDDPTATNGAFATNVRGMFDNMKFPSFTNCVTSTHGVLDTMASKNPCTKAVPATTPRSKSRSRNGKQKKSGQRRKSTSSLDTRKSMRSPYHGETQGRADDDFCVNTKRQEPNGIHFD